MNTDASATEALTRIAAALEKLAAIASQRYGKPHTSGIKSKAKSPSTFTATFGPDPKIREWTGKRGYFVDAFIEPPIAHKGVVYRTATLGVPALLGITVAPNTSVVITGTPEVATMKKGNSRSGQLFVRIWVQTRPEKHLDINDIEDNDNDNGTTDTTTE